MASGRKNASPATRLLLRQRAREKAEKVLRKTERLTPEPASSGHTHVSSLSCSVHFCVRAALLLLSSGWMSLPTRNDSCRIGRVDVSSEPSLYVRCHSTLAPRSTRFACPCTSISSFWNGDNMTFGLYQWPLPLLFPFLSIIAPSYAPGRRVDL
jgi:hypothetical protein